LHPDFRTPGLPADPFEAGEKAHGVAEGDGFLVGDGGGVHVCTMHLRSGGNDAAVSVT
jgi:hypothetical protein